VERRESGIAVFVDSIAFGALIGGILVVDSLAYVGCRDRLRLVNVSDPHHMRVIAQHSLPYGGWRVVSDSPYVYVATLDAGVCIFETTAVGIAEPIGRGVTNAIAVRRIQFVAMQRCGATPRPTSVR